MAHLLSIPENVMIQHVFPCLDHNDLLSLREVSKQTKTFADAYLWTPQPGHQGKWELKIDSNKADKTLEAFLQLDAPPPSRLHIANGAEKGPLEPRSFFKDGHLEEFMDRYSKYVTKLRLVKLFYPFTSPKEIGFYESLVNLEELCCDTMITQSGAAQFERKTRGAEESLLIRPTFKKVKTFKLTSTNCMNSMWNFIYGVSNNLEELQHPFKPTYGVGLSPTNLAPVRELIERRRGMKCQSKLVYDWNYLVDTPPGSGMELNRIYASCRDNGVIIKNMSTRHLDCLLCDENGWIDKTEIIDPLTGEWILNSRVNYQRNLFVGSVIHSLIGVTDNAFLMDLPALEEISIYTVHHLLGFKIRRRHGHEYPQWPNLRKMDVRLDQCGESELGFLFGDIKRPKMEELCLKYYGFRYKALSFLPCPRKLGECCGNLKRLTIDHCAGNNDFFWGLWEELPLLEDLTLKGDMKLTNNYFVGRDKSRPVFLNLKKLKHLKILNLDANPGITDKALRDVFRHLKLSSFKLSSDIVIKKITMNGIIKLFTGPFKKTIEKLDVGELKLEDVSGKQLMGMVSCLF